MKLITKEIEAILPPLYSQEKVPDPVAVVKFFDPCGRYTFYILEVGLPTLPHPIQENQNKTPAFTGVKP